MNKLYAHNTPMGLLLNDKPRSIAYGTIFTGLLELKEYINIINIDLYDNEKFKLVITFDTEKYNY